MAPAILFKDIGKVANNTLSDDYDFNRKLKIKTKTADGVTFTTEGAMGARNAILAKLSSAFTHSSGLQISKLQVTTHGRVVGEANVANALMDGLKLTFKVEDGSLKNAAGIKYRPVGKFGAEYRASNFATTAEADFTNNVVSTTGVFVYDHFVLGAQAALNVEKSAVADKNLALSYVCQDFHASVVTKKNLGVISASFDHKPASNCVYAAVLDHNLKQQSNALTVGGRYAPDKQTTYCGKINSDGFMSLALIQKITPVVALTTSAHIDVKNIEGESHKFGLGLTLG